MVQFIYPFGLKCHVVVCSRESAPGCSMLLPGVKMSSSQHFLNIQHYGGLKYKIKLE